MSETRIIDERVEAYIDQVARALAGVDADERAALLEDVREHAEATLADEPDVDLAQRLGPPAVFARELLDAAGVPTGDGPRRRTWRDKLATARASRLGRVMARARKDFGPLWSAMRGVAVVWLVAQLLNVQIGSLMPWLLLAGGMAAWLLADRFTAVGRVGRAGRAARWTINALTLVVAAMLLWSWASSFVPRFDQDAAYVPPAGLSLDGSSVMGIQAYGPEGVASPVTLFDQDGNPLTVEGNESLALTCAQEDTYPVAVPYLSASGQPIVNAYPARGVCVDGGNVVRGPAVPALNGAAVQTWTIAPLPSPGQTIITNDEGAYLGVAAGGTQPSPTPSAPSGGEVAPSPSAVPSKG
ncbi:MAG: hypothetical protein AB7I24_17665 [Candidatus Nanopelagicales bacterium]|jgi:hypothetical protein